MSGPSSKTKPSGSPPSPARSERRALVRCVSLDVVGEVVRKRSTVIDDLIAFTDDGWVVHVPTGRAIPAPVSPEGVTLKVEDDRAFVEHVLAQDPEAWEESRELAFDTAAKGKLRTRLKRCVNSYRGA